MEEDPDGDGVWGWREGGYGEGEGEGEGRGGVAPGLGAFHLLLDDFVQLDAELEAELLELLLAEAPSQPREERVARDPNSRHTGACPTNGPNRQNTSHNDPSLPP